jgi:hypothetical protein
VIATFNPEDFEHTPTTHLREETDSQESANINQKADATPLLSEKDVKKALASYTYLNDLSILKNTDHLDENQAMALKRLVLKYHRRLTLALNWSRPMCPLVIFDSARVPNSITKALYY